VTSIRLGLRANAAQFWLLVGLNGLVGAMVGLERSVLPIVGERDFGLSSRAAILAFIVAFGLAKAVLNLFAGALAERAGRRRVLILGWLLALPVAPLIALAPSWGFVVAANVFLGASQGIAWSMTVLMKIDLVGPSRRGLALGLNEAFGYLGVALTAFATGALAGATAPRTTVWVGSLIVAAAGTIIAVLFVRDTGAHVMHEQLAYGAVRPDGLGAAIVRGTVRDPVLRACSQAGLTNNLNDALAWGLVPLYLAAHGAGSDEIGVVAAVYPGVWGGAQLATGWLSDRAGRRPLIVAGMLVQAAALLLLVAGDGAFRPAFVAAVGMGLGTALVYPTLIAAVSDAVEPVRRARSVGVYRFWRDLGLVIGALTSGLVADGFGPGAAIAVVAALTAVSGIWVAAVRARWTSVANGSRLETVPGRKTSNDLLRESRSRITRFEPREAQAAMLRGALLVDLRSGDERERHGVIPGSVHIPRSVLEWRCDPDSGYANPAVGGLEREIILFCAEGFSSSLAAATLRELGFSRAGDMVGGFTAWKAAGLPIHRPPRVGPSELPGMRPPEPA
jgi:MFS family permease